MKKIIAIAAMLSLSACMTPHLLPIPKTPQITTTNGGGPIIINGETIGSAPAAKMPDLPANLAKKAGPLPPITDPSLAGMMKDGAQTDSLYNDVAHQLNNVLQAWSCVEDSLNNQKDASACFKGK